MPGISEFLDNLTDPQWDTIVRVIQDLQDSVSPERLESLRKFLASLNLEIDQVNRRRDALGQKVENIEVALQVIDKGLHVNPDLEVELFKSILSMWKANLRVEIADLRPSEKLEKKYDTERKRELLIQIQALVSNLNVELRQAHERTGEGSQTVCRKEQR